MIRFLHISDIHLDTSFYSKKEDIRNKLREGLRSSFKAAIDLCIDEELDGLLIAGDLFDNDKLSFKTEEFLIQQFKRLKEYHINVYYATGNHDPGSMGYRANEIKWPENVHIFKDDNIDVIDLYDRAQNTIGKIISCGHKSNNEGRNLIKDFPVKDGELPHIGLVHAMVTGVKESGNHERYLPCTLNELEEKGYDYWALGHIHKMQSLSNNSKIYYAGNIQGRNPKETGQKGGLLVTIDDFGNVLVDFKPLSQIEWHTISVEDLKDIKDYSQLKKYLARVIKEYITEKNLVVNNTILRLELEGPAYLKKDLEIQENKDQIIEDLLLDINLIDLDLKTNNLTNVVQLNNYREGDHVLAYVMEILDNIEENEEVFKRLKAVTLSNDNIKKTSEKVKYLKELIKGLDEEAVYRMVGDSSEDK